MLYHIVSCVKLVLLLIVLAVNVNAVAKYLYSFESIDLMLAETSLKTIVANCTSRLIGSVVAYSVACNCMSLIIYPVWWVSSFFVRLLKWVVVN